MNILLQLDIEPIGQMVGWTILHSLWQAALIGLLAYLLIALFRSSKVRYLIALSALCIVPLTVGLTFFHLYETPTPGPTVEIATELKEVPGNLVFQEEATVEKVPIWERTVKKLEAYTPLIALLWFLGFVFLMTKWIWGYHCIMKLKKNALVLKSELWEAAEKRLEKQLGRVRNWVLKYSSSIQSPMIVGWFRPVIIIPLSLVNGLTSKEAEAVLAHEAAHILRRDFPVNLVQTLIETIFYYNPFVAMLSNWVRREREHCSDDRAVELLDDQLVYAQALLKAGEFSPGQKNNAMAPALGGKKMKLLQRVERILLKSHQKNTIMIRFMSASFILSIVLFFLASAGLPNLNSWNGISEEDNTTHIDHLNSGVQFENLYEDEFTQPETMDFENSLADPVNGEIDPFLMDNRKLIFADSQEEEKIEISSISGQLTIKRDSTDWEKDPSGFAEFIKGMTSLSQGLVGLSEGLSSIDWGEMAVVMDGIEWKVDSIMAAEQIDWEEFERELEEMESDMDWEEFKSTMDVNWSELKIEIEREFGEEGNLRMAIRQSIEKAAREMEEIDWNEMKIEIQRAFEELGEELKKVEERIKDRQNSPPEVFVDTLVVVDPNTYQETRYLITRLEFVLDVDGEKKNSTFSFSATEAMESGEVQNLANDFYSDLMKAGLIQSGSNFISLKQDQFTVNSQKQDNKLHRQFLNPIVEKYGQFREIVLQIKD